MPAHKLLNFFIISIFLSSLYTFSNSFGPDLQAYDLMLNEPGKFMSVPIYFREYLYLFQNVYTLYFIVSVIGFIVLGFVSHIFKPNNSLLIWFISISFPVVGLAYFNAIRGTFTASLIVLGIVLICRDYHYKGILVILGSCMIHKSLSPYIILSIFCS